MDISDLRQALGLYFAGYQLSADVDDSALDLSLSNGVETISFAQCAEREDGFAFLGSFEAAMQRLIDARSADPQRTLGMALAFGSTAAGQHPSYRRALKKYSNSIVFEDLGIWLYLVKSEDDIIVLAPGEVNDFLRDLDRWIADNKK